MSKPDYVSLLLAARTEIAWWVGEHGCCKGHEDDVMAKINAALEVPSGDTVQITEGPGVPFALPEGAAIIPGPTTIRGKPGEWYLDLSGVLYRNSSLAPYGPWEPVPTSGHHMVNGTLCEWSIDRGDPPARFAYTPSGAPIITLLDGGWYAMRDDGVTWDRVEPEPAATPAPAVGDGLPTDAQVREAMQTAWDDFCDDAQAIPGDIYREGSKTFFRAGTWADHTAMHLRSSLAATPASVTPDAGEGWIVGNGDGKLWRWWTDGMSAWTADREKATRYARREDAEAVHREDEDAWTVTPYGTDVSRAEDGQ